MICQHVVSWLSQHAVCANKPVARVAYTQIGTRILIGYQACFKLYDQLQSLVKSALRLCLLAALEALLAYEYIHKSGWAHFFCFFRCELLDFRALADLSGQRARGRRAQRAVVAGGWTRSPCSLASGDYYTDISKRKECFEQVTLWCRESNQVTVLEEILEDCHKLIRNCFCYTLIRQ